MILVIVGPTGVGKTKLSIELAKKYNAEIINADSMQVYKNLNIGTAKITPEEKENIPHHLFDICDVTDMYSVYDYQKDARRIIAELEKKQKNIIIVGGTGLYIKACLYDYNFKEEPNLDSYDNLTTEEIIEKIKTYNVPISSHEHNRRRLVRQLNKLENNLMTENNGNKKLYNFILIGLTTDRETLYTKINDRVDKMIADGLLDEVKYLFDKNISSKAINTGIGYKELYPYFKKQISLAEAINEIKKNSRRYAKRQYTFFNNQMDVTWFTTNYTDFSKTVEEVETYINKSSS